MSDGPTKLRPPEGSVPALDDIILGDDEQTAPTPPVALRNSSPPMQVHDGAATTKDLPEERPTTRRERSSNRIRAAEDDPAKDASRETARKRQKMTLRIPDDEVSRPQIPVATPIGGMPVASPVGGSRPPSAPDFPSRPPPDGSAPEKGRSDVSPSHSAIQASRIISIGSPDETPELPPAELQARGAPPGRAPGLDASQEAGWTPYQPQVADRFVEAGGDTEVAMRAPLHTILDEPGMGAMGMMMQEARAREEAEAQAREAHEAAVRAAITSSPPPSEDIPIDTDDVEDEQTLALVRDRSDELTTNPRLPAAASSEELREEGERHTDPGELPDEIAPEDLVSVESIPNPHSPHAPPPLKGGTVKLGITPAPAVTATSLMSGAGAAYTGAAAAAPLAMPATLAGVSGATPIASSLSAKHPSVPPAAASTPQMANASGYAQPGAPSAPSVQAAPSALVAPMGQTPAQPPPPAQSSPQALQPEYEAEDVANPTAGTPMARRQQPAGGPFGFMPQVGALAPPAMNEAAAHRKKTRPWWEDLFNDDFIRTMAKITDGDIAREANFIEESLGCEAGATILDLACGTGRHAVELAQRGYQVVGFDLSLAMLARASDEAQDRKQKINFVQGDMREMTFEETFDGVFSWNTSFGYFDEEKNAAVIAKVHRALKKGGQFLLDVVNRDNLIRSAPSLAWFEGDGCICMDEMQIDFITSRMRVKRTLMMDDGRTKEIEYSIRVYSLHELGKMLHDNGFRVAEVSGRTGTPGVFFGCESPRTLILAEKR